MVRYGEKATEAESHSHPSDTYKKYCEMFETTCNYFIFTYKSWYKINLFVLHNVDFLYFVFKSSTFNGLHILLL